MKNLGKLKEFCDEKHRKMEEINQDIKDLEEQLKRSGFLKFSLKPFATSHLSLFWCHVERRLLCGENFAHGFVKPLIECDMETRIKMHVFLDRFIDEILINAKGE